MGELPPGAASPRPVLPRILDVVCAVPISEGRVALRNGARGRTVVTLRLGHQVIIEMLALLNGTSGWADIRAVLLGRHPQTASDDLDLAYAQVANAALLEEGAEKASLSAEQLTRHSRDLACFADQMQHLGSKFQVHNRLRHSRVLIIGAGGIGSNTALGLAMLGIGGLLLADFDSVELQNLNRQVLYDTTAVGRKKVDVAIERLKAVNPDPEYLARNIRIEGEADIRSLLAEHEPDITVLGADRPVRAIDRWTSAASMREGLPYITGAVAGGYGAIWARIPGQTGCEECALLWLREDNPEEWEIALRREQDDLIPLTSALGFGAQIIAGLIGLDILHYLVGLPVRSADRRLYVDFNSLTIDEREQPPHPACACRSQTTTKRRRRPDGIAY